MSSQREAKEMIVKRNMALQIVWVIITLGIYTIYWFYVTSKEMIEYKKLEGNPVLWTVLLFIPFGSLYSCWKHGECVEALTEGKYNTLVMFLAWIVFSPVVWFLTQTELNKRAEEAPA